MTLWTTFCNFLTKQRIIIEKTYIDISSVHFCTNEKLLLYALNFSVRFVYRFLFLFLSLWSFRITWKFCHFQLLQIKNVNKWCANMQNTYALKKLVYLCMASSHLGCIFDRIMAFNNGIHSSIPSEWLYLFISTPCIRPEDLVETSRSLLARY